MNLTDSYAVGSRTSRTGNPSQLLRVLLWLLHLLPDRFMSVSTPQPTPCMHIYTKRIHQRPALITRRKINTTPQMVSFTQRFLCICISVWVFVRRTPAGKGSLHTLFYIRGWVHDSTSRAFICRAFTPGRSSSTLFQGTSRLMQARWGLHAFPLTSSEMIDSELWLPRIRATMETWQFKRSSCFSWPQKRGHWHSPETALNWNVWICALTCAWLFSFLICGWLSLMVEYYCKSPSSPASVCSLK